MPILDADLIGPWGTSSNVRYLIHIQAFSPLNYRRVGAGGLI